MEIILSNINKETKRLDEILYEFQKTCESNDFAEILKYLDQYDKSDIVDQDSIMLDYQRKIHLGRTQIHRAYLRFMSLCLFFHQEGDTHAAWYYFSRAEYFKGIYNAWDEVKKTEEMIKLLKEEKINAKKELSALDQIVSKALKDKISSTDNKSNSYWTNKSSFAEEVKFDIYQKLNEHKKFTSRKITYGVVKSLIYRLIKADDELNELFKQSLKTEKSDKAK